MNQAEILSLSLPPESSYLNYWCDLTQLPISLADHGAEFLSPSKHCTITGASHSMCRSRVAIVRYIPFSSSLVGREDNPTMLILTQLMIYGRFIDFTDS